MHFTRVQLKNWRNFVSVDLKLGERLFITGPKFRDWGFMTARGWVRWSEYLGPLQPDRSSRCSK